MTKDEKEAGRRAMMGDAVYQKLKEMEESFRKLNEESGVRAAELEQEAKERAVRERAEAERARVFVDQIFEEQDRQASLPPPSPPKPRPTDEELFNDTSGTPQPTDEELKQILKPIGKLTVENGKPNLKAKAQIQLAKATRFMRNNKLPLALLLAAGLGYGGYRYWKKRKQHKD